MIRLEIPNASHQEAYEAMMALWWLHESIPTSPSTLFAGNSYSDFLQIRESYQTNPPPGKVRASLFFVIRGGEIIGAVDIRHEIASSEYLTNLGGHIGYGILPTERGKWYATEALRLGLVEAKKLVTDVDHVLVVCMDENVASAKVIEKNWGELESKIKDSEWNIRRRYWIAL